MSIDDKILKNDSPWGSNSPPGGGRGDNGNGSGQRRAPPNIDDIIRKSKNSSITIDKTRFQHNAN